MGVREKETHLLILWSEAFHIKQNALENIEAKFTVRRVFNVCWSKADFNDNLRVFYAHSQKDLSPQAYEKLLESKKKHCGEGVFWLVVFDDPSPVYEERNTSDGMRPVNINVFDFKQKLRVQTDGGHKVHATDNTFESNKDLTLLLGVNLEDFDKTYPGSSLDEIEITTNCTGVGGYRDISQLFYVLNNTIDYCVMRNYECLPDTYTLEGHGDIDLLVEHLNYVVYLTNAQSLFPELKYRVHYNIRIGEQDIPFDFRFLGDDYYDLKWELDILKNKRVFNEVIYVPDPVNYFYSLLYHAYIHKAKVRDDYHQRLQPLGDAAGIDYHKDLSFAEVREILDAYMEQKGYSYTVPVDETVFYNTSFFTDSLLHLGKYGKKIAQGQSRDESQTFMSQVFEKDNVITKVASKVIIDNEVKFLSQLSGFEYFPKILHHEIAGDYGHVQLERIEGDNFATAFEKKNFWTKANLLGVISDAIEILKILIENNILHRDIRPENLILTSENGSFRLTLIDFGWAVAMDKADESITPRRLGAHYRYGVDAFSDAYSMGKSINFFFVRLPFYKKFSDTLTSIKPEEYNSPDKLLIRLQSLQDQLSVGDMGAADRLFFFYYRSPLLRKAVGLFGRIKRKIIWELSK